MKALARNDLWVVCHSTKYTAFVLQNNLNPSLLVPRVTLYHFALAYSVPLPAPPEPNVTYDSNLPVQATTPFLSNMANFTTVLTSLLACATGTLHWYPEVVKIVSANRKWLCVISFTRCCEPSPANPDAFTAVPASPSVTGLKASLQTNSVGAQVVFSALLPQQTSDPPRNPVLPALGSAYDMLLPCLEMCNEVDRACPPLVQFMCPIRRFNAAASYGVGYIDGPDGEQYQGLTSGSQDRWGNVWCHKI